MYQGKNGLSWPPFGLPSDSALLPQLILTLLFAVSYIQLLIIAGLVIGYCTLRPNSALNYLPLGQLVQKAYIHPRFHQDVLIPLFACVCTCSKDQVNNLPAVDVLGSLLFALVLTPGLIVMCSVLLLWLYW